MARFPVMLEIRLGQAGHFIGRGPPRRAGGAGQPAEDPAERHPPQPGDCGKGAARVTHGHIFAVDQDDQAGTLGRNGGNSPR